MENKYNKSGKLSKRKMKLINYEDKISKMRNEELAKELLKIANESYAWNLALNGVWATVTAALARNSYDNDDKANFIFFGLHYVLFFINFIYSMNKDAFRSKKLKILSNYVDSEEVKEEKKDNQKNLSK